LKCSQSRMPRATAAGSVHRPARDAHDGVPLVAQARLLAETQAELGVGHHFPVRRSQGAALHEPAGRAQPAEDVVADHGELRSGSAGSIQRPLGRVHHHGARRAHARRSRHPAPGVGGDARGLVEGAAPAALDHPQVGRGVLDQPDAVLDVAAIDAVHDQHDGQQHRDTRDGGEELAEVAPDFLEGEFHGGPTLTAWPAALAGRCGPASRRRGGCRPARCLHAR
jgi:hypothetical protein